MLKELTTQYIDAFNSKNIDKIAELFADNFALEDPVVKRIEGKKEVLAAIQGIFNSCEYLSFIAKNIYRDNQTTVIEFTLKVDETILSGTDIIEWNDTGTMSELRAYLDIPK
jgi:hypothetical protein